MKYAVRMVIGVVIAVVAWIPLNTADPRDIPVVPAMLGVIGTVVGGVIVLVALVGWVRGGSRSA